jgi:hypothetical protein
MFEEGSIVDVGVDKVERTALWHLRLGNGRTKLVQDMRCCGPVDERKRASGI